MLFEFRTEAQDGSGHFRRGQIEAESREAAKAALERQEFQRAAYQIDPDRARQVLEAAGVKVPSAAQLADLHKELEALPKPAKPEASEEDKAEFRQFSVNHRAWLNIHRQEQPYKLVHLRKVGDSEEEG
jgi:hypothetical protein